MKNSVTAHFHRVFLGIAALAMLLAPQSATAQQTWHAQVGAETPNMGRQALAFLPNEIWIHAGDRVDWTFNTDEIHTVSFLVVGQKFPPFPVGCPGFNFGSASFNGSACVTTPPTVKGQPDFTVTFPTAGNYKVQCLVHNTMNGVVHVLALGAPLPHDQAFYDQEAAKEARALLQDKDHAQSGDMDMSDMNMNRGDMVNIRVLAANSKLESNGRYLAPTSDNHLPATAHVAAGVGEIVSTPGGVQTSSLERFVHGKIVIHAGDTVEWGNFDPEEPHTITFGPEPQDRFDPSSNVTVDPDGGLHAVLNSPSDSVHSGFIVQASPDEAGTPVNSTPNNSFALNPTRFRVTFKQPGTYNYKCSLHDNLGMVGQVIVLP